MKKKLLSLIAQRRIIGVLSSFSLLSVLGIGFANWASYSSVIQTESPAAGIGVETVVDNTLVLFSYDSANSVALDYITESFWVDNAPNYKGTMKSAFTATQAIPANTVFSYSIQFLPKSGYTPTISLLNGTLIPIPRYTIYVKTAGSASYTARISNQSMNSDGTLSYTFPAQIAQSSSLMIGVSFDASYQWNASTSTFSSALDFGTTIYPYLQNTSISVKASWEQ